MGITIISENEDFLLNFAEFSNKKMCVTQPILSKKRHLAYLRIKIGLSEHHNILKQKTKFTLYDERLY